MNFADRISEYRLRIDAALDRWLPDPEARPSKLHEALRYSVLGGGKRVSVARGRVCRVGSALRATGIHSLVCKPGAGATTPVDLDIGR